MKRLTTLFLFASLSAAATMAQQPSYRMPVFEPIKPLQLHTPSAPQQPATTQQPVAGERYHVKNQVLNLRTGPSTSSTILAALAHGEEVVVISATGS
jgi:uncharacterized protein YgiM (DUF1202 family)